MSAKYGTPEWYAEVESRHVEALASVAPKILELKKKYGVLDAKGRPTGKVLSSKERAALMAEADALVK